MLFLWFTWEENNFLALEASEAQVGVGFRGSKSLLSTLVSSFDGFVPRFVDA